jgi:hypothetical protein
MLDREEERMAIWHRALQHRDRRFDLGFDLFFWQGFGLGLTRTWLGAKRSKGDLALLPVDWTLDWTLEPVCVGLAVFCRQRTRGVRKRWLQ